MLFIDALLSLGAVRSAIKLRTLEIGAARERKRYHGAGIQVLGASLYPLEYSGLVACRFAAAVRVANIDRF
jgi:hypothetical protein